MFIAPNSSKGKIQQTQSTPNIIPRPPARNIHPIHHQISPLSSTVGIPANLHTHHLKNPKIIPLPSEENIHIHIHIHSTKNHPPTPSQKTFTRCIIRSTHHHRQWEYPLIFIFTIQKSKNHPLPSQLSIKIITLIPILLKRQRPSAWSPATSVIKITRYSAINIKPASSS